MKLQILYFLISVILAHADPNAPLDVTDVWKGYDFVDSITLGDAKKDGAMLKINLLEKAPVMLEARGGFDSDDHVVRTYHANTPSHGFVVTSEGDLFIDNKYVGKFKTDDNLVYGFNKFWSNGVPRDFKDLTPHQTGFLYDDGGGVFEEDGTRIVDRGKWTIYLKPAGGDRGVHIISNIYLLTEGMTAILVKKDQLVVNGIRYGLVAPNQIIKVCDGVVSVDQIVRSPVGVFTLK